MTADVIRPTESRGFTWHLSSGGTLNCAPLENGDQLLVYDMSPSGRQLGHDRLLRYDRRGGGRRKAVADAARPAPRAGRRAMNAAPNPKPNSEPARAPRVCVWVRDPDDPCGWYITFIPLAEVHALPVSGEA